MGFTALKMPIALYAVAGLRPSFSFQNQIKSTAKLNKHSTGAACYAKPTTYMYNYLDRGLIPNAIIYNV